ncbi:hypothetical protein HDU98_004443, partial [Podochytrium sp. JEL0797]
KQTKASIHVLPVVGGIVSGMSSGGIGSKTPVSSGYMSCEPHVPTTENQKQFIKFYNNDAVLSKP